jgi:LmbE family N-acetylglucosaminyl deacetylase
MTATPKQKYTILAIHAHPDDVEFQCAGTLALLAEQGHHIHISTMTPGDCGSASLPAEEIAAIRRSEAKAAAEMIGATYHCLEFGDLAIFEDDASRRRVTEHLRKIQPDIILTAPAVDYLCDHEITHKLVRDACFAAPIPNYKTKQWEPAQPMSHIPHLYFVDALEGADRCGNRQQVDFYVDVSKVFAIKRDMLACHASQREWLLKHHGIDEYLMGQEKSSRLRGSEAGVEHAEGFWQYGGHAYPQTPLLQELLKALPMVSSQ